MRKQLDKVTMGTSARILRGWIAPHGFADIEATLKWTACNSQDRLEDALMESGVTEVYPEKFYKCTIIVEKESETNE